MTRVSIYNEIIWTKLFTSFQNKYLLLSHEKENIMMKNSSKRLSIDFFLLSKTTSRKEILENMLEMCRFIVKNINFLFGFGNQHFFTTDHLGKSNVDCIIIVSNADVHMYDVMNFFF